MGLKKKNSKSLGIRFDIAGCGFLAWLVIIEVIEIGRTGPDPKVPWQDSSEASKRGVVEFCISAYACATDKCRQADPPDADFSISCSAVFSFASGVPLDVVSC
ncbi:conserved hypothetical protein [Ricinus communis]|uniref:Uncharacterized protein n=1 Tax=Ricinus communis TaxID=3988 RepID=B9RYF6_RICCO|nr:conserved hypothetical protein [Ricinus communis]